MIRLLTFSILPLTMIAAAWGVLAWVRVVPPEVAAHAAYAAMGVAALVCWRFKRARALVPLGLCALVLWFSGLFDGGVGQDLLGQVVYPAMAVLLPLNWTAAVLAGDRGLFNRVPITLAGLVALQAATVLFIATGAFGAYDPAAADALQAGVADFLHFFLVPLDVSSRTPLAQPALLCACVCAVVLMVRGAMVDSPMDSGLGVSLLAATGVLHFAGSPLAAAAMATGAALAMAAPLVHDSYRMAFLDELTGLPARRSLMADMRALSGRYAVAMADVDHFKKFNDTYGHDTGDEVLRMVAAQLARVSGGGRAYRYGGEEFTILFSRKDAEGSVEHLEAVREAIADSGFTVRKRLPKNKKPSSKRASKVPTHKTVSVTISMGVAEPGSDGASSPEEVLKAADKALYKAKKKGRNRVEKG